MASIEDAKHIILETPISTIINYYHPITKKGANYQGICPFHADSHPSMSVNDSKGIYKCFACGAGGDAIKFVREFSNLGFVDAIKEIAGNLGIQIEEKKKKADPKYEMGTRVLKAANRLYRKVGNEMKPQSYTDFLKNRKLNEESIENFEIGFAPGNNALTKYLGSIPDEKERKFALDVAKQIGLIRDNKHGPGHYDFYRDRVMFPIWDHSGTVRGFTGRAVLENQKPKYMNSIDSFMFDKGNTLYGFNLAKKNIRQQDAVILAEGQMDVIALHQYGFNYAIASSGTAFGENSVRLLSKMAKTIYLAMDSDPAGIDAMKRTNTMFLGENVLPRFVDLAPAKDPDDFLKEFGRLELINRIEKAPAFLDYIIEQTIPKPIPETVDQKLEILNQIFELVSPLKEGLLANEKVVEASKALGLRSSNEDVIEAYKSYLKSQKQAYTPKKIQENVENNPISDEDQIPETKEEIKPVELSSAKEIGSKKITRAEAVTLEKILTHPECVQSEQILEILDLIDHFEVKRVIQWLKEIYLEIDESDYTHMLKSKVGQNKLKPIDDAFKNSIRNHTKTKLEPKVSAKLLKDCGLKIQVDKLKDKKRALATKQKASVTEAESIEFLNKILEVEKQLRDLKYNS